LGEGEELFASFLSGDGDFGHLECDVAAVAHQLCANLDQLLLQARQRPVLIGSGVDAVARLVGIEGGVVSGVFNLESSGVEAPDWRPRHDEHYHEA
jgi:hypothetical protein